MDIIYIVLILLTATIAMIIVKITKLGRSEIGTGNTLNALNNTLNAATANLGQQITKTNTDLTSKILNQRQPVFRGSRSLIMLPSEGIFYNNIWTIVPPGQAYAPFDYGLSMPATFGYYRMYKLHVTFSDNIRCPSTGCNGGGTQLEICIGGQFGTTNACPTTSAEFSYNLGITSGSLAPYSRDWYSPLFDPTLPIATSWQNARVMIRIDPASYTSSSDAGILYNIEVEAWDVPSPITTLPNPYCANVSGIHMCLGMEDNTPVCYGGGSGGCQWGYNTCTTDKDCTKYAVGQPDNTNKYRSAAANQCTTANTANPSSWTDFACISGTTTFHH